MAHDFHMLPNYDIEMPWRDRAEFDLRALWLRNKTNPAEHWSKVPQDFVGFRRFVRDQVLEYSNRIFQRVRLDVAEETHQLLLQNRRLLLCFIHHGFFPLIAFVVKQKYGHACTTIGTAPSRNLSPSVNPDHLFWKYAFYYQARRWLGTRFIFSDEPPRIVIEWLKNIGSLTAAIDVIEEGVTRKSRAAVVDGVLLRLPETVTRLARASKVPMVAASLYKDGETVKLKLGSPHFVTVADDADSAFQQLATELFDPYLRFPEQRFFDLMKTFASYE